MALLCRTDPYRDAAKLIDRTKCRFVGYVITKINGPPPSENAFLHQLRDCQTLVDSRRLQFGNHFTLQQFIAFDLGNQLLHALHRGNRVRRSIAKMQGSGHALDLGLGAGQASRKRANPVGEARRQSRDMGHGLAFRVPYLRAMLTDSGKPQRLQEAVQLGDGPTGYDRDSAGQALAQDSSRSISSVGTTTSSGPWSEFDQGAIEVQEQCVTGVRIGNHAV